MQIDRQIDRQIYTYMHIYMHTGVYSSQAGYRKPVLVGSVIIPKQKYPLTLSIARTTRQLRVQRYRSNHQVARSRDCRSLYNLNVARDIPCNWIFSCAIRWLIIRCLRIYYFWSPEMALERDIYIYICMYIYIYININT